MKLPRNARVCCLGDSITHWGQWIYDCNAYLSDVGSDIRFYNCGVSGNIVSKAPYMLMDEVLWLHPDYVLIMYGANDVEQSLYKESSWKTLYTELERTQAKEAKFKRYAHNMRITCDLLAQADIHIVLMTAPPFDCMEHEGNHNEIFWGINEEMARYADEVKKIAEEYHADVIDIFGQFNQAVAELKSMQLICDDRIHPSREGMRLIASVILNHFEFPVSVPRSKAEYLSLPFRKTRANDDRFETEQILRECAAIDWQFFRMDEPFITWEEKAEELALRAKVAKPVTDDMKKWWDMIVPLYRNKRGKRDNLRKCLISQTETVF